MDEIKKIFKNRDKAVNTHNLDLFVSTQIDNHASVPDSFLSLKSMRTEILHIHSEKEKPLRTVVLVKENYIPKDNAPYSFLAAYQLVKTTSDWKIYRLTYIY